MRSEKGITTTTAIILAVVVTVIIVAPVVYLVTSPTAPTATAPAQTVTVTTSAQIAPEVTYPTGIKWGFITTSDETDLGWSASAVEAADYADIKYEASSDVTRFAVLNVGDTPRMIRDYVAAGYDVILTNGAEFSVYVLEPALEAPDVKFIAVNIPPSFEEDLPPNVIGVNERSDEAQYLSGIVAGHMTQTNNVGMIIGENYLPLHAESLSYTAGVKSVSSAIDIHLVYAGTWIDATLGYTLADAMIEEHNVDVIDQVADVTGRGVVSAAVDKNIWVIGCYGDQSSWAPNNTLTSYELDYAPLVDIVYEILAQDKWDEYGGKIWNLGLKSGTGYLVPFTFFIDGLVPDEAKASIEQAKQDIINGTLRLPGDDLFDFPNLTSP